MTPKERMDKLLKGLTWEEAEEIGIEILARCCALHVYARKEDEKYILDLSKNIMGRVCDRADEWAHEGDNPTILALAACGHCLEHGVK